MSNGLVTGQPTKSEKRQQNFAIQNGGLVNPALTPVRASIMAGLNMLEFMEIVPFSHKQVSTNMLAHGLLGGMACSVSSEGPSYSLLFEQTDKEVVVNPNILDSQLYATLAPKTISALDKFINPADAFYTRDEPITRGLIEYKRKRKGVAQKTQKGGDINKLASAIIQTNATENSRKKSKYFNNRLAETAKQRIKY